MTGDTKGIALDGRPAHRTVQYLSGESMPEFDVVVAGGGPAGLQFARERLR